MRFLPGLDRDWLGRVCHLSAADLAVSRRRTGPVTRLGWAARLVTVRAIGTFRSDPAAVHTGMRSLLDALDGRAALAGVLGGVRAGRAGIGENMGTVADLMRRPGIRSTNGSLPPPAPPPPSPLWWSACPAVPAGRS